MRMFGIVMMALGAFLLVVAFLADPAVADALRLRLSLGGPGLQVPLLVAGGALLVAGSVFATVGRLAEILLGAAAEAEPARERRIA